MKYKIRNKLEIVTKFNGIIFQPNEVKLLEFEEEPIESDRFEIEKIEEKTNQMNRRKDKKIEREEINGN